MITNTSLTTSKLFFRKLKETTWLKTEDQLNENSIVVKGLETGLTYQFRVVAVDGKKTFSKILKNI